MFPTIMDWARHLLFAPNLEDKLAPLQSGTPMGRWSPDFKLPSTPGRSDKLAFSDRQFKFPKTPQLTQRLPRAQAIHSFGNHELLAIEMMASALLWYPHAESASDTIRYKRGIVSALQDEQKHLGLYVKRIRELGYDFGEFPLNDFFWRQMNRLTTPESFFALMALTFESANLDFALYYEGIFREADDVATADVLKTVFDDELAHVGLGGHWLSKWAGDRTLWDYYQSVLPVPLTPARARGIRFNPETRLQAGLPANWVKSLEAFVDPFKVTQFRGQRETSHR